MFYIISQISLVLTQLSVYMEIAILDCLFTQVQLIRIIIVTNLKTYCPVIIYEDNSKWRKINHVKIQSKHHNNYLFIIYVVCILFIDYLRLI